MIKTIEKAVLIYLARIDKRPFYIAERGVFRALNEVKREEAYAFIPSWAIAQMSQESIDRYIEIELALW